jgi:hypothetical protein
VSTLSIEALITVIISWLNPVGVTFLVSKYSSAVNPEALTTLIVVSLIPTALPLIAEELAIHN